MPDLDLLSKRIPSCFQRAYRLLCGAADDGHVVYACKRGMSLALRQGSGVPSLAARAALLAAVHAGANADQVIAQSRLLIIVDGGTRHAQLAHRALQRLIAEGAALPSAEDDAHLLAKTVCHDLVDHHLLSRVSVESSQLGQTPEEFASHRQRLHNGLAEFVDVLATQLVADPTAVSIHPPPVPRPARESMESLLRQVVG